MKGRVLKRIDREGEKEREEEEGRMVTMAKTQTTPPTQRLKKLPL